MCTAEGFQSGFHVVHAPCALSLPLPQPPTHLTMAFFCWMSCPPFRNSTARSTSDKCSSTCGPARVIQARCHNGPELQQGPIGPPGPIP